MASPSDIDQGDKRSAKYSILSGTSMSCPHAAGAAAYLESMHPNWSPSAIKSALLTTARKMNATKNHEAELAYGPGHIDPVKPKDPGLVHETFQSDYISMFCNLSSELSVSVNNSSCTQKNNKAPKHLNYPLMSAKVSKSSFSIQFPRTITNVGTASSTYKANITQDSQPNVTVEPPSLSFTSLNEKISFIVSVAGQLRLKFASASLEWSDGVQKF